MNDRGDQKAANDEEDVDAGKTAGNKAETGMEQEDWHHGKRAQSIDFGSVMHQQGEHSVAGAAG